MEKGKQNKEWIPDYPDKSAVAHMRSGMTAKRNLNI
jgi:hypothetical protein